MRSVVKLGWVSAALMSAAVAVGAQSKPDPRVGLKPGLRDAGEAAKGMEKIASLFKPEGFFDPKVPAGTATPPERDPSLPPPDPDAPPDPRFANMLAFANSDLAFSGTHLFLGSFHGFNTYDIERPGKPKLSASIVCPGGQGDMSVHGNLLFMSVEQTRGRLDCGTEGIQGKVSGERFRGVRIFDIGDLKKTQAGGRGADVPRIAHAYPRHRPEGSGEPVRLRIRHRRGALRRGARRLFRPEARGRSEHGAVQHRRHQGAAGVAGEGRDRQPAAHLRRRENRRAERPVGGR